MKAWLADLDAVRSALEHGVANHPDYADQRNLLALVLAYRGNAAGARTEFEHALGLNAGYDVARFNLAWLHVWHGDREPGGLADAVARALPADWRAQLGLVSAVRAGDLERARTLIATAPPEWADANRLWLAVRGGDGAAAASLLTAVAESEPDWRSVLSETGLWTGSGSQPGTLETFGAAYHGNPHGAALSRVAADLARAAGSPAAALRHLAWSAVLSSDLAEYWNARATHHAAVDEDRVAIVAMKRSLEIDPNRIATHVAFGFLLAARGDAAQAIQHLEAAARRAPGYADVRYQLGLLYTGFERWEEAERELRAALVAQPAYAPALLTLASVLEERGQDAEALQCVQQARHAGLRSADTEVRLARLHQRLGHLIQARRARARARAAARGDSAR